MTSFYLTHLHVFLAGWEKTFGSPAVAGGFGGVGFRNVLKIKLGLFGGFFEIDIDNWAKVSCARPPLCCGKPARAIAYTAFDSSLCSSSASS